MRDYIAHQAAHDFSFWAVIDRATRDLIGDAGLWGRGYATEAARACVEAGFREADLDEMVAVVDPASAASLRVLEKLGMKQGGERIAYGRWSVCTGCGVARQAFAAAGCPRRT